MYIRTSYGSIICIRLYGYNLSSLNGVAPPLRSIRMFICLQRYKKSERKTNVFEGKNIFFSPVWSRSAILCQQLIDVGLHFGGLNNVESAPVEFNKTVGQPQRQFEIMGR